MVGDKYQLLRKAGEGAMGSVWVAANTALEANVAIKVLRPEMRSPAIAERLLREARAAAKLSHPGIVRVFDLGKTADGTPYIVMELLEGEALRDVLCRDQRLLPEAAIAILLPVASAMHAAHERGVVHRDLKPDNVMLADLGDGRLQPKVVDFGIAKVTWTEPESGSTGAAVIGTPQYMPPEQALGQGHIDHRADIWALCTMLYEVIAGETPYAGEQGFGTLRAILQDPVPSLVERCGTDPALWSIIERGLRKDPADRWGSMRELGVALATWLVARGVSEDVCGASLRAQWLDERTSQVPAQSPRPMVVSSAPTLHSRRAEDALELQLPLASTRRAPTPAGPGAPVVVGRKALEESGERAWSEATAMGNLQGAAVSPRPSLRERFPFRRVAAAGFVLMAGAAAWSVAPVTTGPVAELTPVPPAAPAVTVVEAPTPTPAPEAPTPEPPAAAAGSLTASMARGLVVPSAPAAPAAAAPAAAAAPRPSRTAKAAPPASPATAAAAAAPTLAQAATPLPELPAADAGADATLLLAQAAPAAPSPEGAACPTDGGHADGEAACPPPPAAEGSAKAVEPTEDAAAGRQEHDTHGSASEEPPPAPAADAGAAEPSPDATAAP
ncbi:serine/threonine-protein kinase [Sorangium sp. So ce1335]|uniref:serine/threonine-protein kinase n=1 Tax=Sorangium sp. So ce1335 TaxID=3133335 RepID=UPI003F609BF2